MSMIRILYIHIICTADKDFHARKEVIVTEHKKYMRYYETILKFSVTVKYKLKKIIQGIS